MQPITRKDRLSPTELYVNCCYHLIANANTQFKETQLDKSDLDEIYYAIFEKQWPDNNTETIITLQTSSDQSISLSNHNSGCVELSTTLSTVNKLKKENPQATYIMPLAECRDRAHYVLLIAKEQEIRFYDPKSQYKIPYFSVFKNWVTYNINYIDVYIKNAGFSLVDTIYTKIQPTLDQTICGFVVLHLVNNLISINPLARSELKHPAHFDTFNKKNTLDFSKVFKNKYKHTHKLLLKTIPWLQNSSFDNTEVMGTQKRKDTERERLLAENNNDCSIRFSNKS